MLETDFAAPRAAVWDLITRPGNRLRWQGRDAVVENTANGRRGDGTQNHRMHGKDAIIEDVLAWRPFDHITLTTLLPVPAPKILMSYAFDERADGGAHFEVRFAKPKPRTCRSSNPYGRTCKASRARIREYGRRRVWRRLLPEPRVVEQPKIAC